MTIKVLRYKSYDKPPTMGFCDVLIEPWKMEIRGITVLRNSDGAMWFNMPSRGYTNEAGEQKYMSYVYITDKDWRDSFNKNMQDGLATFFKENAHGS